MLYVQAQVVTSGTRFVLAMWFTLSASHGSTLEQSCGLEKGINVSCTSRNETSSDHQPIDTSYSRNNAAGCTDTFSVDPGIDGLQKVVDSKIEQLKRDLNMDDTTLATFMQRLGIQ